MSIVWLAGLQGIPDTFYEAAQVDGAGRLRQFFSITLPLLTPTIFFIFIISLIGSFQAFGLIFVMTGGGPGTATYVYVYHLWKQAFQSHQMGYGAALAWMLFVVIGAVTFVQWRLQKRWVFYQ